MLNYVKIFKALGDKTRMRIVLMLRIRQLCVCEIQTIIGFSMSTISNHLKILKEANLIESEKRERYIYYQLNDSNKKVQNILDSLKELEIEIDILEKLNQLDSDIEHTCSLSKR